jgi:heme oxygenase (mycobilin-producing)
VLRRRILPEHAERQGIATLGDTPSVYLPIDVSPVRSQRARERASVDSGETNVSVNVVVNFQASDGNAESLLPLLREGRDLSRKAEGCEAFDLFQRQDDPHKFMFIERWTSIDAHHANMAANIVASGHLAKMLPLLVGPPDNGVIETV